MFSSKTQLTYYLFTTGQNPLHTAVIIRNKPQEIKNSQLVLNQQVFPEYIYIYKLPTQNQRMVYCFQQRIQQKSSSSSYSSPSSAAEALKPLVGFDFLHNSPLACPVLYSSSPTSDHHHHTVQPPCTWSSLPSSGE